MIELKECEKCGKKLTARTLKYSHADVCSANENTPPAKSRKKEEATTPDSKPPQVVRLRKRQEQRNTLFANANNILYLAKQCATSQTTATF